VQSLKQDLNLVWREILDGLVWCHGMEGQSCGHAKENLTVTL
jgi:hypothetical protein